MKIAFCIRNNYLQRMGGDTIQLLRTREYLEKSYNIESEIITNENDLIGRNIDICHIFNVQTLSQTTKFLTIAKGESVKTALSTIFWDFSYTKAYDSMVKFGLYLISPTKIKYMIKLKQLEANFTNRSSYFSTKHRERIRNILQNVDVLLPNSIEELELLAKIMNIERAILLQKSKIVINATDIEDQDIDDNKIPELIDFSFLRRKYILQVARIEPSKNQYSLIKSLIDNEDLPILLIGNQKAHHKYFQEVKKVAEKRANVHFLDHVEYNLLPFFYRNAIVHVLPSLRETPGLVNLEALKLGCKIVISDRRFCPVDTYFSNIATVVDPLDLDSIKNGIFKEIDTKRNMNHIRQSIANKFNWEVAASQTYDAYMSILN